MTPEAWFVCFVLLLCFGLLASNRFSPDLIMMGGLTLVLVTGVISPQQALSGLSNEGMVTVGVLYIVVSGFRETGGINWIVQSLLGVPKNLRQAQLKVMTPVAFMSAFLNNTPVAAVFIPAIDDWAKRNRLSVSKLMLPMSYAAIAGGTCTLIGTSTNLVINGLIASETDYPVFAVFDLALVGVPLTLTVFLYVLLTQDKLLPERKATVEYFSDAREYIVEMIVEENSPQIDKTIEQAGLRQLPGLFLMEIDRNGHALTAVSPREKLQSGDRLVFVGIVDSVVDLQRIPGLKPATDQIFKLNSNQENRFLTEVVVSNTFPMIGRTIRQGRFRTTYNAVIIGVARNGRRINKKIGDIRLYPGDTLLMISDSSFAGQHKNSRDFYLINGIGDLQAVRHERAPLAIGILFGMVTVVALGWLSLLKASMLAAGLMIISRCTTGRIARRAIDWQILVVIAASFGMATALQASGAASHIGQWIVSFAREIPILSLALVYLATAIFSSLVTNNAAAVIMFPIALSISQSLGVNFLPFAISIMMAASASFATPIGYQTNLMVYGAGGYVFKDYVVFGGPLTIMVGIITVFLSYFIWGF